MSNRAPYTGYLGRNLNGRLMEEGLSEVEQGHERNTQRRQIAKP